MAIKMDDYKDEFSGTGVENKTPVAPEDEFFHAVYIGHTARKNHIGVIEESGKFHIRGVQYNLNEVYMIITLTKKILVKTVKGPNNKDQIECFSFQDGPLPHKGTKGYVCGLNANERALNQFCGPCRAQLIVTGILCDEAGNPMKGENGKPIFGFLRGKGMRYAGVSDHLNELTKMELPPIVKPITEESKAWEKKHVNQSRVVTKISRDIATSSFNSSVNIFKFEIGHRIPDEAVEKVMDISKKTVEKFKEKFDWSKTSAAQASAANSYAGGPSQAQQFNVPDDNQDQNDDPFDDQNDNSYDNNTEENNSNTNESKKQDSFGFDDLAF